MAQEQIEITKLGKVRGRRGVEKKVDIKPRILAIKLLDPHNLELKLLKMQRPDEVMNLLTGGAICEYTRSEQAFGQDKLLVDCAS